MIDSMRSIVIYIFSAVLLVAVITVNAFMVFDTIDEMAELEKQIENTDHIVDSVNALHAEILTVESGQRGFLLTGEKAYLAHYTASLNSVVTKIETVSQLQAVEAEQQARIEQFVSLTRKKLDEMVNTVELAKQGNKAQALEIVDTERGLVIYQQLEQLFSAISSTELATQLGHRKTLNALITDSKFNFLVSSGVIISLLLIVFLLIFLTNRKQQKHRLELQQQNENLEDIVHQRTLAIQVYSDELARSNRELEDFAFVASHDLQEPLRKIRAFGDRLKSNYADAIDERGQDFLTRMLNAAERMSKLISDLLEFSRVSTRGKPFVSIALDQVVADIIDDLEIAIEQREATVEVKPLPQIDADPSQMHQLFLNLVSNALKFCRQGVKPVVEIYAQPVDSTELVARDLIAGFDYYDVYIKDNGIGFEQEYEEKIFAPFQRLHGRTEYDGTGIGLAVCRRIVERHNGRISAKGTPGEGSVFKITVPTQGQPFGSEAKLELESSDE